MTLREQLTAHRATCTRCTLHRACGEYLTITRRHTRARQLWTGPVAARTILTARKEGTT
jgi:hypothetical protein